MTFKPVYGRRLSEEGYLRSAVFRLNPHFSSSISLSFYSQIEGSGNAVSPQGQGFPQYDLND
jgi:hypothetical protein